MSSTPISSSTNSASSESEQSDYDDCDNAYFDAGPSTSPLDLGDWGPDASKRYNALCAEGDEEDQISYGSDELVLEFWLQESPLRKPISCLSWPKSRLWYDRAHPRRYISSEQSRDGLPREMLRPFEKWGRRDRLEYALPGEPDRLSVSSGISFPKINPQHGEFRLLILHPHYGDDTSPVKCYLMVSALFLHSCYIAIRNSRGNPALRRDIFIDNLSVKVSANLFTFLQGFRSRDVVRVLWVRELCINKQDLDERQRSFNLHYQRFVENCSCGIVEMDRVMESLEDANLLQYAGKDHQDKLWDDHGELSELPWHRPCHLSSEGVLDVGYDLTQEQICQLPYYRYVPLDLVSREIRLLSLYPADRYDDPIVIDISHAPLRGELTFAALSYTWGSSELTSTIRAGSHRMQITANLDSALRKLRKCHEGHLVVVWVDAISIDQKNEREKARHIMRMQEIFESAYRVYVWLGLDAVGTNWKNAIDFIFELNRAEITIYETDENGEVDYPAKLKKTERLAHAWADLYRFFKAPLFTRRWCIQEIASASVPTIIDGVVDREDEVFLWRNLVPAAMTMEASFVQVFDLWTHFNLMDFIKQYKELEIMTQPSCWDLGLQDVHAHFRQVKTLTYVRDLRANNIQPSFLLLALLTTDALCSHSQDRLFSLWSLAKESRDLFTKIAYSESTEESYTAFAKTYARHTGSLDILCASQYPAAAHVTDSVPYMPDLDLPSWCSDWRQHSKLNPLVRKLIPYDDFPKLAARLDSDHAPYHADTFEPSSTSSDSWTSSRDSREEINTQILKGPVRLPFSFDGRTLLASGIICDQITHVVPFDEILSPPKHWVDTMIDHYSSPHLKAYRYNDALSAFLSMMIGEPEGSITGSIVNKRSDGGYTIESWIAREELTPSNSRLERETRHVNMLRGRTLVITEKGYMGLAPWHVKVGFKLAILLGCSVPILLEEISEELAQQRRGERFRKRVVDAGEKRKINESLKGPKAGLYFRGDCYVQGWMGGEVLKHFGTTNEEAWKNIRKKERLRIH